MVNGKESALSVVTLPAGEFYVSFYSFYGSGVVVDK